jgi:hypothetical protein
MLVVTPSGASEIKYLVLADYHQNIIVAIGRFQPIDNWQVRGAAR